MRVGVPAEIKTHESRVALPPAVAGAVGLPHTPVTEALDAVPVAA